jgi:hypothetical protein
MEMLNRMHALQTAPVLEPHDMLRLDFPIEGPLHELVNLPMSFRRQAVRCRIVLEVEFCPDD